MGHTARGYGNSEKVKKVRLQHELLSTGEQETIKEYIGTIQVVVNAMQACDKIVKDKKIVRENFKNVIVAIEECKDLKMTRVEELHNSFEAHEQHLIERKITEKSAIQSQE